MPFKNMPVSLQREATKVSSASSNYTCTVEYVPWEGDDLPQRELWNERLFGVYVQGTDTMLSEKYWSVMEVAERGSQSLLLKVLFRGAELSADLAEGVQAASETRSILREAGMLCLRIHTGEVTASRKKYDEQSKKVVDEDVIMPFYALLLVKPPS